jgi:MerR family transcriptional regulator, thiopeptide resistance regulator
MSYSAGEVSKVSGVSVRTLHHYDEIGLLSPSGRSAAGYRQYQPDDLARLQQILCYRALGFDLRKIATILDDPRIDALDHLRQQRELLNSKVEHLQRMVRTVEKMMEARKMGINLNPDEMFEVFGDFDPAEHAEEAEQRWGKTDAFKESARRTSKYKKEDWKRLGKEADEIGAGLAEAMKSGAAATSPKAMDLAEQARLHIDNWFYPCSHEMHRNLGEMYVADPRFAKHYEDRAAGLAVYVRDAIAANADRAKGKAK